jgi:hypothetical protein
MPYGQRKSSNRDYDEEDGEGEEYVDKEETDQDKRRDRNNKEEEEKEEEEGRDAIQGSEDHDTLRQINQAYRQLETDFRDSDDFYPDWNNNRPRKRKRYKDRDNYEEGESDYGDYDKEKVVIRQEEENYDDDYGDYNDDERTFVDGDDGGGVVRVKSGGGNDDDDEADAMSAGEDNGDVHIHLRTLLDNKALKFLWDKVPWDEIIAANRYDFFI